MSIGVNTVTTLKESISLIFFFICKLLLIDGIVNEVKKHLFFRFMGGNDTV